MDNDFAQFHELKTSCIGQEDDGEIHYVSRKDLLRYLERIAPKPPLPNQRHSSFPYYPFPSGRSS